MVGKPSMSEHLPFEEASRDPVFAQIVDWIRTFLCAPHPDLGRDGDVCPFARSALTRNSIEFYRNHSEDLDSFEQDIGQHMVEFEGTAQANLYSCRVIMPVKIEPLQTALTVLIAILVTYLASIYPALRASRVEPVEGLKAE